MASEGMFCVVIGCLAVVILAPDALGLAIRGRQTTAGTCTTTGTTGTVSVSCMGRGGVGKTGQPRAQETRFELLGCPCALVGIRCAPDNSLCFGPNGDLTPNIGTGSPKRGVCGCRTGFVQNCTSQTCVAGPSSSTPCRIAISGSAGTISPCQAAFSRVTGLTLTQTGCTGPIDFLLAAAPSADVSPFVGIDPNTLEVFVTNLIPTATTRTQNYSVAAVDFNGLISNQVSFQITLSPFNGVTACTCT